MTLEQLTQRVDELEARERENPDDHLALYEDAMVLEGDIIAEYKNMPGSLSDENSPLARLHERLLCGVHDRHAQQALDIRWSQ